MFQQTQKKKKKKYCVLLFLSLDKLKGCIENTSQVSVHPCFWSWCVYVRGLWQSIYTHHLVPIISLNRSLGGTKAICWCYSNCLSLCLCPDKTLLLPGMYEHLDRSYSLLPGLLWRASPPRCLLRRRRRRKPTTMEGRERLGQRERRSCKDKGVGSGEQVSLPLTYWQAATVAPTLTPRPTCTPTQGSEGSGG